MDGNEEDYPQINPPTPFLVKKVKAPFLFGKGAFAYYKGGFQVLLNLYFISTASNLAIGAILALFRVMVFPLRL